MNRLHNSTINLRVNSCFESENKLNNINPLEINSVVFEIFQFLNTFDMESTVSVNKAWEIYSIENVIKKYDTSVNDFIISLVEVLELPENEINLLKNVIGKTPLLACKSFRQLDATLSSIKYSILNELVQIPLEERWIEFAWGWEEFNACLVHLKIDGRKRYFKKFIKCAQAFQQAKENKNEKLIKLFNKFNENGFSNDAFELAKRIECNTIKMELLNEIRDQLECSEIDDETICFGKKIINEISILVDKIHFEAAGEYWNLASHYVLLEDKEKAIKAYQDYLTIVIQKRYDTPVQKLSNAYAYKFMGDLHNELEENEKAIEAYQKSVFYFLNAEDKIEAVNGSCETIEKIGDIYYKLEQYDTALNIYRSVISIPEIFKEDLEKLNIIETRLFVYYYTYTFLGLYRKIANICNLLGKDEEAHALFKDIINNTRSISFDNDRLDRFIVSKCSFTQEINEDLRDRVRLYLFQREGKAYNELEGRIEQIFRNQKVTPK